MKTACGGSGLFTWEIPVTMKTQSSVPRPVSKTVGRLHLETDSNFRGLVDELVIGRFISIFPHITSFLLSQYGGELPKLLCDKRETGSFRLLEEMYKNARKTSEEDVFTRLVRDSPAAKAARNRRKIAQALLNVCVRHPGSDRKMLVVSLGGGNSRLELEVLRKFYKTRRFYYCCIDKDPKSVAAGAALASRFRMTARSHFIKRTIGDGKVLKLVLESARDKYGVPFQGVDVTMGLGILEYVDLHSKSSRQLGALLRNIRKMTVSGGRLIIGQADSNEWTKYLAKGLGWDMHLRTREEVCREVQVAGWGIDYCEKEPVGLITMCLATKE